jgi:hypothetical protein
VPHFISEVEQGGESLRHLLPHFYSSVNPDRSRPVSGIFSGTGAEWLLADAGLIW